MLQLYNVDWCLKYIKGAMCVWMVYVAMESVDSEGVIKYIAKPYDGDKRVEALLTETWGADTWNGWQSNGYRLGYGVLYSAISDPRMLQWVEPVLSNEYNPTFHELFQNITLRQGEAYYLLISKLNVSPPHSEWVQRAMQRFKTIYPQVTGDEELVFSKQFGWIVNGSQSKMSELLARMQAWW